MGGQGEELGPVQLLAIGFAAGRFDREILAQLRLLRDGDAVRLIDLLFVAKDLDGEVAIVDQSYLSAAETAEFGELAGALLGVGAEPEPGRSAELDDSWFLADAIPPGTMAAIALVEHRWATPLRRAIAGGGADNLLDTWVHPQDLLDKEP